MTAILFISIILLVGTSFILYRSKRSSSKGWSGDTYLQTRPISLFEGPNAAHPTGRLTDGRTVDPDSHIEGRSTRSLLDRAHAGDRSALLTAHESGDRDTYREVLDALVAHAASSDKSVMSLASFIYEQRGLRASARLAERLMKAWRRAPDAFPAGRMLHIAALSDEAATYQRAVDAVLESWHAGALSHLSAGDLRELLESEYWVLSPDALRSGAGFVLKRRLADVRRQLADAATRTSG